jgi:hypothetical protein
MKISLCNLWVTASQHTPNAAKGKGIHRFFPFPRQSLPHPRRAMVKICPQGFFTRRRFSPKWLFLMIIQTGTHTAR